MFCWTKTHNTEQQGLKRQPVEKMLSFDNSEDGIAFLPFENEQSRSLRPKLI